MMHCVRILSEIYLFCLEITVFDMYMATYTCESCVFVFFFTQDSRMKCWTVTCERIFTEPINLWINDLSPLFTSRVQVGNHFFLSVIQYSL